MDHALQAIFAAAAGFAVVSTLFALLLLCFRRRSDDKSLLPQTLAPPPPNHPSESFAFDPALDRVSMAELAAATKNFDAERIIGDGSFGFVYKARLANGATVAVKRLSVDAFHGLREFRAEMETLGRVRHPNLARLLGYCASGPDRVLVYEFLDRGSLDGWLHEPAGPAAVPWPVRLRIARGAAAGLAFLHHECRPRIIHRDIKASNVLLDEGFEPRIADFGLARWVESSKSHVSTQVAGTMGYMPPEYRDGMTAATVKADVYSFGILLLELVAGRRPNLPVGKEPMVRWARRMVEEGRWMDIADRLMGKEGLVEEEVKGLLGVAYRCSEEAPKKRPSMREVVALLDQLFSTDTSAIYIKGGE